MASRRQRMKEFLRRRRWQLLWAIGFLIPVLWTLRLLTGSPTIVPPSEQTTYLTGDTLADGSLDFSSALWEHCNCPIDDGLNAAIPLRELGDPIDVEDYLLQDYLLQYALQSLQTTDAAPGRDNNRTPSLWHFSMERGRLAVRRPWTREEYPLMAEIIDRDANYIDAWKQAISRPAMAKPVGTTLRELKAVLVTGASRTLAQGMLYAGEQDWDRAIDNFQSIDAAADHLIRLQCGWIAADGLQIRADLAQQLSELIQHTEEQDERFASYVRSRCQWPGEEILAECLDQSIRIRGQLDVRDVRDPNGWRLGNYVSAGLTSVKEVQKTQLRHIRNSIDWTEVSRIQNELIDGYLKVLQEDGLPGASLRFHEVTRSWAKAQPHRKMIDSIKALDGDDISVPVGQTIALAMTRLRVSEVSGQLVIAAQMDHLARLTLSIQDYRMTVGRLPRRLTELPESEEIVDPTTGSPFEYADHYGHPNPNWRASYGRARNVLQL